jgi:S-adenosylmethionine decarboxylase
MKSRIAPEVFRKRLLLEGYFSRAVSAELVREYLLGLAAHLNLRTYGDPIVFAPASGMGREDNAGFDGFVPLIDSGISVYVWSAARFVSAVVYTCKDFDGAEAVAFTKVFFDCRGEFEAKEF